MKEEVLLIKVLILVMIFGFSACQKSAAENAGISPLLEISPSQTASPTPSPNPNSPIRKVDFKNFTFPWTPDFAFDDEKTFALKDGEITPVSKDQIDVRFAAAEYGDVTNDGAEEAFVNLSVLTGGSSVPNMIYVYTLENSKPKLLWSFDTGDRAEGGFKNIYAENGELAVELFGDDKFENGEWIYDIAEGKFNGLCCPTTFTKFHFKWNGKNFIVEGKPEFFDYDWRKQAKKN